jgi:hypothetical protein
MSYRDGGRYTGTVTGGGLFESAMQGTLGFQVLIECEEGETDYTIWLTEKNKDRAAKDFETLGHPVGTLRSKAAFDDLGDKLKAEAPEIQFGIKAETYNKQTRMKVSWIGKKKTGDLSLAGMAATFFGADAGKIAEEPESGAPPVDDEDEIPF